MIERTTYLNQLKAFTDKPQVKVISGIRRSGKSTILKLMMQFLQDYGIEREQMLYVNFESLAFSDITHALSLYEFVKAKIIPGKRTYLFLDEIQEVIEWEKAINSFLLDFDTDIYITGSNSHLLSSELATYLAGRYIQIPVYTLSFEEFIEFKRQYSSSRESLKTLFTEYLRKGGFPGIYSANFDQEASYQVIRDIYSSVILRDTIQRYKIRDVELLERVIRYAFDNIGNTFSGKNVADYFKSQFRKTDINTIYNYLHHLEGSYLLFRVPRYDIKGKEILKTQEKYYLGDISLMYATMGYRDRLISGVLENIVYLELRRRGYQVYIGKLDSREIDFIAEKQDSRTYYQVAYKVEDQQTFEREFSSLQAIKDHHPKFVISMDDFYHDNIDGIRHISILDFLLNGDGPAA